MFYSLVVIDDFDIEHVAILESETDTPLIVHADAMLPLAITLQSLQPIARRGAQKVQCGGGVQLRQFALGNGLDGTEAARTHAFEQRLGVFAAKGPDHAAYSITLRVICQ